MHVLRLLALVIVFSVQMAAVRAQSELPDLPREILDPTLTITGDTVRFCYYPFGPTAELDVAMATAIADALLVEAETVPAFAAIQMSGLDIIPMTADDVFLSLTNDCDAFMGFTLAPGAYPEWLSFSRPYVQSDFVAVTTNLDLASLDDLPAGEKIGTLLMSEIDSRLGSLMRATAERDRWRILPYPSTELLVQRLADGTVTVAAGWEPTLIPALKIAELDYRRIALGYVNIPPRVTAVAFLAEDSYLQSALDDAIGALNELGELDIVIASVNFPGESPPSR